MKKTVIAKHVSRATVLAVLLLLASLSRNNRFPQNKQNTSGGMVSITVYIVPVIAIFTQGIKNKLQLTLKN